MADLRNRLQRARTLLAPPEAALIDDLTEEKLLRYQDKLNPILEGGYHDSSSKTDLTKNAVPPLHILLVLTAPIGAISNLTVRPGEPHFLWWYYISTYFPLLSACVGPLSNCISIVALIEHWRQDKATQALVSDPPRVVALNSLSLGLGIIGNMSLLMNFSGTVKYLVTQIISIICWCLASVVLMVALLISNKDFTGPDPAYARTEGFWFATFTCFFYFVCACLMSINYVGYRLQMYPPVFNLDNKQRLLMFYTVFFSFWLVIGAVVVEHLIKEAIFGSALYFCVVSVLTVGLGDIVPKSAGAKVFVLLWSFIGVLTLGLIITMVRQVTVQSAGPTIFWHRVEIARQTALQAAKKENLDLTPEDAYTQMRLIRQRARSHQATTSLVIVLFVFFVFWFLGACIFHYVEGWSYFNSIYFCFLCFITIGYGDFTPQKPLGRVFFVSWGLAAVPLMTVLISNLGDQLYDTGERIIDYLWKWLRIESLSNLRKSKDQEESIGDDITDELDDGITLALDEEEAAEEEQLELIALSIKDPPAESLKPHEPHVPIDPRKISENLKEQVMRRRETYQELHQSLEVLKPIIEDSIGDPKKSYTHEEWRNVLQTITSTENAASLAETDPRIIQEREDKRKYYWLSERSPLRLPLMEPNYMILKLFFHVERDIQRMLENENDVLQKIQAWIEHTEKEENESK